MIPLSIKRIAWRFSLSMFFATDDQEEASNMITKYDLEIWPVVNHSILVLGVITADEIVSVIDQEYTEDILAMGV